MRLFSILTGLKYVVLAKNEGEALKKFNAMNDGSECSCSQDACDCVDFVEADTWIEAN
jgi:hypothetical protein